MLYQSLLLRPLFRGMVDAALTGTLDDGEVSGQSNGLIEKAWQSLKHNHMPKCGTDMHIATFLSAYVQLQDGAAEEFDAGRVVVCLLGPLRCNGIVS